MGKIWNESNKRSSQLVLKLCCCIVNWCIWKISAPVLSCDAILNMTKVELEPISDDDMYLFIKKDIRGRVSCISKKV